MSNSRTGGSPAFLDWLKGYRKEWLAADVVAGLTVAAVVIPKSMAYATIAGLPVQVGLYTALVPMLVYALLGTSRPLSVSTTTTLAILTGAQLALVAPGSDPASLLRASAMLTLLVGGILFLAAVLRLGFVANFISEPVLIGFKAGIGLVIVLDQVPKLLGVHFQKGSFLHNVAAILKGLPQTALPTLAVGLVMILLLVGIEHFLPRIPAPLIAVAAGISGMAFLGLGAHGVTSVGRIPQGLPSFILPDFSLAGDLWAAAIGIALMSFTETISAGRAFARTEDPPLRANRELLATGLANAAGAVFGAMPAGGGTSQTAVNRLAGARTQLAQMVTVGGTLVTMLLLAPLLALMPEATLAAVVIVYSIGLIKPAEFRAILRVRRTELVWAVAAMLGVMVLGTLRGILVAIIVSIVALAAQVADPPVYEVRRKRGTGVFRPVSADHPDDESFPGLLMVRTEGRVFFLNVGRITERLGAIVREARPRVVVLDGSAIFDLEYTALKALMEDEERLRREGVVLALAALNPEARAMVERSPLGATLGRSRMFFNLEQAVGKYTTLLPPAEKG